MRADPVRASTRLAEVYERHSGWADTLLYLTSLARSPSSAPKAAGG